MANLDALALLSPMRGEQIGDEAAMTFLGTRFGAKEGRSRRPHAHVEHLRDSAFSHQAQKSNFVSGPIPGVTIGVEQLRSWSEPRFVGIIDAGNFMQKIFKVWMLGETGKLAAPVQPDIDDLFHLGLLEKAEKFFCRFSRESDRAEENFHKVRSTRWLRVMRGRQTPSPGGGAHP